MESKNHVPVSVDFEHSHKKKYGLETCARVFFILLWNFFVGARPHREHNFFTEECSTLVVLPKIK